MSAVAGPPGSEFDAPALVRPYGWSAEEYLRQERTGRAGPAGQGGAPPPTPSGRRGRTTVSRPSAGPGERPGTADSERRARVVRGRRRMLSMLVVLTAIAIGFAYLSVAAWWIVVPPTVLLLGYLMLLREAAHADAEARERAAVLPRRAREAETQRAREAEAQRAAEAQREQARRAAQAGTSPGRPGPGLGGARDALPRRDHRHLRAGRRPALRPVRRRQAPRRRGLTARRVRGETCAAGFRCRAPHRAGIPRLVPRPPSRPRQPRRWPIS